MAKHEKHENIEPDIYTYTEEERGVAAAQLEQKRSEILDVLKTSKCFTVSILDDENGVLHSTFVIGLDEHDAPSFLSYAALKTVNDLTHVIGMSMEGALDMLKVVIKSHPDKDWDSA